MTVTIGSLFSGIGGLELGLERADLGPVVFQCELDPFCRAVLEKHWPHVTRFVDVTQPRAYPPVDLLCGGFPCQDVSSAGKRRGIGGSRSGLWYHFAAIVRQIRLRFVVVENVASGQSRWLPTVRQALRRLGYRTRALGIAAADVGAPHLRRRVFVVAYAKRDKLRQQRGRSGGSTWAGKTKSRRDGASWCVLPNVDREAEHARAVDAEVAVASADDAYADRERPKGSRADPHESGRGPAASAWRTPFPDVLRVADGLSRGLDSPRTRIKALGNSVVPQCAEVVGLVIQQMIATAAKRRRKTP